MFLLMKCKEDPSVDMSVSAVLFESSEDLLGSFPAAEVCFLLIDQFILLPGSTLTHLYFFPSQDK